MIRAVVRSMALAAVKGQARSQRMFTALLQATEKERKAEHDLYQVSLIMTDRPSLGFRWI